MMDSETLGYQSLASWFGTRLGTGMLTMQQELVDQHLSGPFGARQLECGLSAGVSVVSERKGWLQWQSLPFVPEKGPGEPRHSILYGLPKELPFGDDELDVVVLHHTLDIAGGPHQALREAARVLRPGGQILVVGFNPWSLWGLRRLLSRSRRMPWQSGFLRPHRLTDWLHLLDFEVSSPRYRFFRPPTQNSRLLSRLAFMETLFDHGGALPWGAFYVMTGEKRKTSMIRANTRWETPRNVVAMPLANRQASRSIQKQEQI